MEHIFIKNIEYTYSTIYISRLTASVLEVTFDFGCISDSKILIPIEDIKEVSEVKIKKYILEHINFLLERKFIDEI